MQVGMRERANGTIVTGPWLDRPAPRRPPPIATKAKGPKPQQRALALAPPPTVMHTHLKPDATGTLAPRASVARPEWVRDRSKTATFRDLQDSPWGCRLVTGRTSRADATKGRDVEDTGAMCHDGRTGAEPPVGYDGGQMTTRAESLSPEECHYTRNTQSGGFIPAKLKVLHGPTIHIAVGE